VLQAYGLRALHFCIDLLPFVTRSFGVWKPSHLDTLTAFFDLAYLLRPQSGFGFLFCHAWPLACILA